MFAHIYLFLKQSKAIQFTPRLISIPTTSAHGQLNKKSRQINEISINNNSNNNENEYGCVLMSRARVENTPPPSKLKGLVAAVGAVLLSAFCAAAVLYPIGE